MSDRISWSRGWRGIVLIVIGVVMGANLIAPAVAHVGGTINHLWSAPGHIRAKVRTFGDARWLKRTARPGYNYNNNGQPNTLIPLTTTGESMTSVTLQAPSVGFAWVTGKAQVFISHTNGSFDNVICKLSKTSGDVTTPSFATGIVRIPSANPTASSYVDTIEITGVFSVVAGANTVHLNCYESSGTGSDGVLAPEISALFVSSRFGTGPAPATVLPRSGADRMLGE